MSLAPGTRLRTYEIKEAIGAGGMGEVYRARDIRLQRDVAVKVLPELFAADPERLARFEREAQALAGLNHPHIAQIYGIEESEGRHALVMELVEGDDLSRRIARGPVPIDDAVAIARQIADAVEAAHEQGIVHRDLKPANIKVRPDGTVKVLDFGLAKARGLLAASTSDRVPGIPVPSGATLDSPTLTSPAMVTQMGVVLGTAAYMSPEQARGKPVDRRADVWAFGCIVYEMLTGRPSFTGESVTETLAAIIRGSVDWAALPAGTPPALRGLLERCLEKDPRERLRDIGEARIVLSRPLITTATAPGRPRSAWPVRGAWVAAGVVLGLAGAVFLARRDSPGVPAFSLRQLTELPGAEWGPDISPDGRHVVYASAASGTSGIYLLRVGGGRAINLTANSEAGNTAPAFSPDGERIAFRSERDGGGLFVMGATGESVRRLTTGGFDPRWSPDGRTLAYSTEPVLDPYSRSLRAELWTVDVSSGKTALAWKGDAVQPAWSPSGTRIAYWANTGGQRDIWTVAAAGGAPVAVTADGATDWSPEWSPDGRWLYFVSDRGGSMNLWRVALDEETGIVRGAAEPITNGVRPIGFARFSRDGTRMAVMAYSRSADLALYAYDPARPDRVELRATIRSPSLGWCSPSREGTWLACTSRGSQEDIVLLRADGSETRRLTDDGFKDRVPVWSPDDRSLVFMSARSGGWELWAVDADGSGLRQVTDLRTDVGWGIWSPDGRRMLTSATTREPYGLWLSDSSRTATAEGTTFFPTQTLRISPVSWSAAGDLIAGWERDEARRADSVLIWDMPASRVRASFRMRLVKDDMIGVSWVPGRHQVLADAEAGLSLVDVATGRTQIVLPVTPPFHHRLSGDGRTLLIEREVFEGDVWLMTFEGGGS